MHIGSYSYTLILLFLLTNSLGRMWIVETPSPASSAPPTPTIPAAVPATTSSTAAVHPHPGTCSPPGNLGLLRMGGRLTGVVSLTDILHLIARSAGLAPDDPNEARRQRRRSSSSSMRASFDQGRGSIDLRELREHRGSIEIRR
jgi:hypothetical protein